MSHITMAASENAFRELFKSLSANFSYSKSHSGSYGTFTASYSISLHTENGTVSLNDDNTIEIKNVDIIWDTLKFEVCFDFPKLVILPGFCIVPDPWNGCLVGVPDISVGGPICAPLDLSGLVSKINEIKASLVTKYFIDPARTPSESDLEAEYNGHPNKWQIYLDPTKVLVNPIDVPATVGNMFEQIVKEAIYYTIPDLGTLFDWVKNLIWSLISPLIDAVKDILGIVGEITDWISNLLSNVFGLVSLIETAIADYYASQYPIQQFEDPYPIPLPFTAGLIAVKIPIRDLTAKVNSEEMIIQANVGA